MSVVVESEVARAVRLLESAKAPSLLVGPGVRPAAHLLGDLAARLGAAVLTTPDAKSLFDETSPFAAGVFSFGATASALAIAEETDVVLAIGTNLGEFATRAGRAFAGAAIVHLTEDPFDLAIGRPAAVALVGDVAEHLGRIAERLRPASAPVRWFERRRPPEEARQEAPRRGGAMDPGHAVQALGRALPARVRLVCDVTSAALHVLYHLRLGDGQRLWLQIERSACMGSALAAGLGVRLGSDLPTVIVIGDWGLMMGGSELHTVASMALDRFVIVVWSNAGGALIRAGVRAQGLDVPNQAHSWTRPRFASVARGFGMRALTVHRPGGLERAAAVALRAPFPVLIDAVIEPDAEIPGASTRFAHLTKSAGPR